MIDKNDVKMPVQRENTGIDPTDPAQVAEIQTLLRLVNDVNNAQKLNLRLGEDHYSKFTWFGREASGRNAGSYFSYQEQAVYDFIFNLNKSGILSDQVGMGKTIEAGMIISELASRGELKSLLIVVPNEIMSEKWQTELEEKFGVPKPKSGRPGISVIRNYDDFCTCVFNCLKDARLNQLNSYSFRHEYSESAGSNLEEIIKNYVKEDIDAVVRIINKSFADSDMEERVEFDGEKFFINGGNGTVLSRSYRYDATGKIKKLLQSQNHMNLRMFIAGAFVNRYIPIINSELSALYTLVGDYFVTYEQEGKQANSMSAITDQMTKKYPLLVVPISYACEGKTKEFLNRCLLKKVENYKHKYTTWKLDQNGEESLAQEYEEYRVIDFFIDSAYDTLIVDEVHDYINVSSRMERKRFHAEHADFNVFTLYPSSEYNRYELFDDYYFIKKSSLYKKLKLLADKANRKIFLTATPIKSDMVDFYLLALLASNKDSEAYKKIQEGLIGFFPTNEEREGVINDLYQCFLQNIDEAVERFCQRPSRFLALEQAEDGSGELKGRYKYPYFNNPWLEEYGKVTSSEYVSKYLKGHAYYLTVEEIVMEFILSYIADRKERGEGYDESDIYGTVEEIFEMMNGGEDTDAEKDCRTRVVFRTLFNNNVKMRFEKDFMVSKVNESGEEEMVPVKRIRELLESKDGPRKWYDTYAKYGIRHARHQTYNLSGFPQGLSKLSDEKANWYRKLPVWPKREGKVIFLVRADVFFDRFLEVRRQRPEGQARTEVSLQDIPNHEKLKGDEAAKEECFQSAVSIFNYINNQMSGGSEDTHEPQSSKYDSIEIDDAAMVEFKLALVSRLMSGTGDDKEKLGEVKKKVLLFAENGRDKILEWFRYRKCTPLYKPSEPLDEATLKEYEKKWTRYAVQPLGNWHVSTDTTDLQKLDYDNLLIIIDPSRYEKGVDLQKADTIINFDINYDPLKMEQRIGRIDRIRPKGSEQQINIVSFVPLNDMSGFVINFFANEMKMFTQWMGETTGIVSVPEEENELTKNTGEEISFVDRVEKLEERYMEIYRLCNSDVSAADVEKYAETFGSVFGQDANRGKNDFLFLQRLRPYFDEAFRNSVMPMNGTGVRGRDNMKVVRFNSALKPLMLQCAEKCGSNCPNAKICEVGAGGTMNNSYKKFEQAVKNFFVQGKKFYEDAYEKFVLEAPFIYNNEGDKNSFSNWLLGRKEKFASAWKTVEKCLQSREDYGKPFFMKVEEYWKIFGPMKELYWDAVVERYLGLILERFHKQCDSVLEGAKLFERFIKTLSIADFMKNMEGTV